MIIFRFLKWFIPFAIIAVVYVTFFGTYKHTAMHAQLSKIDHKVIVLTFDDGPVDATGPLLDMLKETGVKAAFFVIGEEAKKRPELLKRIQAEGHIIGNHSWNHPYVIGLRSKKFIEDQIDWTNDIIKYHTGKNPLYMRAPFGESTPYSDWIVRQKNMIPIHWTLSLKDWQPTFTKEDLQKKLSDIDRSEMVFLHDRVYANAEMRQALKESILDLQNRGFEFITLDQLYF
jgi:peptidoglycan/xylan/chitin deacetylase (PgdA/CDA1 family)